MIVKKCKKMLGFLAEHFFVCQSGYKLLKLKQDTENDYQKSKNNMKKFVLLFLTLSLFFISACSVNNETNDKQKFTIMWSIYTGWMPWPYAENSGILQKWADKYNIEIELKQADYIPSIEAYVSGAADGVVMTNMEALNFAGTAGIDSTAIIIGDYSNGNDAIISRNILSPCDLQNKNVYLSQFSVSHYLLARSIEINCHKQFKVSQINLINTSDTDIGPIFIADSKQDTVITWNPIVLEILNQVPKAQKIFDSSQIPYEILDIMFINTNTLKKYPDLGKALTGAWYETLEQIQNPNTKDEAFEYMADKAGTNTSLLEKQFITTKMWWTPKEALKFIKSEELWEAMEKVTKFSFDNGLYGINSQSATEIGIEFPNNKILGDEKNIKIRFTDFYMNLANQSQL